MVALQIVSPTHIIGNFLKTPGIRVEDTSKTAFLRR
jgi:hypothetical protein